MENARYGSVADDRDAVYMRDEYIEDIIERFYAWFDHNFFFIIVILLNFECGVKNKNNLYVACI